MSLLYTPSVDNCPHCQALALALLSADGREKFFAHPDHEAFVSCVSLLLPLPVSLLYTHSLPPYCCPYPCPYCTLTPSLPVLALLHQQARFTNPWG